MDKFVAVYMTLGNLYPFTRSHVDLLQLVLCKEKDIKYFKQEKIFQNLINDLKHLETVGINIGTNKLV